MNTIKVCYNKGEKINTSARSLPRPAFTNIKIYTTKNVTNKQGELLQDFILLLGDWSQFRYVHHSRSILSILFFYYSKHNLWKPNIVYSLSIITLNFICIIIRIAPRGRQK